METWWYTLFISDWSPLFACSWFLHFLNVSLLFAYASKQRRWCEMTNKEDTTRRQSDKFQFSTSISRRFIPFYSSEIGSCFPPFNSNNRECKKLRRHIKIELSVKLSLLGLFHVDHVVQNRRTALSLAWYEWFSCKGKGWKIYYCELALSSEP